MPRLCANLGFLFGEMPFLDRFDAAARAGFVGVEYASPYDYPAAELRTRLKAAGLTQVLINSPAGNRAAGERGMACIPERAAVFRDSIHQAVQLRGRKQRRRWRRRLGHGGQGRQHW